MEAIFGPVTLWAHVHGLHAFTRPGEDGLYVLDAENGNLFYEAGPVQMDQSDSGHGEPLMARLIARKVELLCRAEETLSLEDAYARIGPEVDDLVAALDGVPEVFDLRTPGGVVPLACVLPTAQFAKHRTLPIVAVSQPLHTSEVDAQQWWLPSTHGSRLIG